MNKELETQIKNSKFFNYLSKEIQDACLENDFVPDNWRDTNNFIKGIFDYDSDERIVVLKDIKSKNKNGTQELFVEITKENFNHTVNGRVWSELKLKDKIKVIKWIYLDYCKQLNLKPLELTLIFAEENVEDSMKNLNGAYNHELNIIYINIFKNLPYIDLVSTLRHELQHYKNHLRTKSELKILKNSLQEPSSTTTGHTFYNPNALKLHFLNEEIMKTYLNEKNIKYYEKVLKDDDKFKEYRSFVNLFYFLNGDEHNAFKKTSKIKNLIKNNASANVYLDNIPKIITVNYTDTYSPIEFKDKNLNKIFKKLSTITFLYLALSNKYNNTITSLTDEQLKNNPNWNPKKDANYLELTRKLNNNEIKLKKAFNYLFDIFKNNQAPKIEEGFFKEIDTYKSMFENADEIGFLSIY